MQTYIVLLRGINVGGKNKVPMAQLRQHLEALNFADVSTYIASGNVLLRSDRDAATVQAMIEQMLPKHFALDAQLIRVLALTTKQLEAVVTHKPAGFGEHPEQYYSDAIFLMGITASDAMTVFNPREGVDAVWHGDGVIYSQRLAAERTKSRLSRIVGTVPYQSMTIRSWATTTKLLALAQSMDMQMS